MTILQIITVFIALISTAIWVSGTITSWIGIILLRENYYDKTWFSRSISLIISCISITALIYWYIS